MAFEDKKTRLNHMLSGQSGAAPAVGKQTRVDASSGNEPGPQDHEGADGGYAEHTEGGEGSAVTTKPSESTSKTAGGNITLTSSGATGVANNIPRVGVGQKVTLSAKAEGAWTIDGADAGTGQSIDWTASEMATIRNVAFEPGPSADKNAKASLPVFVIAPSKLDFKKLGDVPATGPGTAGVGMTLQVSVGPDDVSFGNAEWLERPGPAEDVTGYFAAYVASGQSLAHSPNPNWLPMGNDNKGITDNVWTRDKPKLKHADGTTRWWAGSFQWTIPNVYRAKGFEARPITNVVQRFTMDDAGAITVTKGGASATARPDNQLAGDIQKFTSQDDARNFLEPHGRGGCVQAVMNYARSPKADPSSVQFLVAALRHANIKLHVAVTCKNTFAWTDPDTVTVSANGKPANDGRRKLNTGKTGDFDFQVNDILDMNKIGGTDPINLAANVEDFTSTHPHSASLAYPYNVKNAAMNGSDRYTYSANFE